MREFTVKKGVIGYIVTIGCQVAGFSKKEDLIAAITEYVQDPEGTEKKYYRPTSYPTQEPVISAPCGGQVPQTASEGVPERVRG